MKFVSIALNDILKSVGTDAILRLRGVNGGAVATAYGYKDISNGLLLGDLISNNLREVTIDMQVLGREGIDEEDILIYQLEYVPFYVGLEPVTIINKVSIKYSNEPQKKWS